jgi:hypothetical protein
VLVSWPRSTHSWHACPIRLANGLGIAVIPVAVFIFEPVLVNVSHRGHQVEMGVVSTDVMESKSLHTCPGQRTLWTNARASVAHCWGQFAGQVGNVELAAKLSVFALSMVSTLAHN